MKKNDLNMKVSIIIPIYRVEPHIERCIQSVLQQTYRDLEVILVDDCTPDHSMKMAKACIEQSPLSKDLQMFLSAVTMALTLLQANTSCSLTATTTSPTTV